MEMSGILPVYITPGLEYTLLKGEKVNEKYTNSNIMNNDPQSAIYTYVPNPFLVSKGVLSPSDPRSDAAWQILALEHPTQCAS